MLEVSALKKAPNKTEKKKHFLQNKKKKKLSPPKNYSSGRYLANSIKRGEEGAIKHFTLKDPKIFPGPRPL